MSQKSKNIARSKIIITKSRLTDLHTFSGENMKLKSSIALALFCASSAQATSVFINEIHYDNEGSDSAELIEVAAPAGTDLSGMTVVLYNGSSSQLKPYSTLSLSGIVGDESNGYGFVTVNGPSSGIQNGSPDGLALVDASDLVIQFLSYEGSFRAAEGPAAGMLSENIGVEENNSTPLGFSLQLAGENGSQYTDFTWQSAAASTSDNVNNGQSFSGDGVSDDEEESSDPDVISGDVCTNCSDVPKIKDSNSFNAESYYEAAQTEVDANSSKAIIKAAINDIISNDHKNLSYSQVWTSLTYTDEDPLNTNNVILWYSSRSQAKSTNGSGEASSNPENWNREHSWPKSHGFSSDSFEAFTDIHHLRPTDISINSSRGNLDFDNSDSPLAESPNNRVDSDSFEPRDDVKGDVARMMFYMDARYEGSGSDLTPDLLLVNRITTTSESKLGWLCTLVSWNAADPVDVSEQLRNDRIYELQGNRNPFTDNPDWVEILYPATDCDAGSDDNSGGDGSSSGDEISSTSTLVFINEFHYDNASGDTGEAIEIAGSAGTDLSGVNLVLYNGSNGTVYNTISLSGVLQNQQNGFGTASFDISGIQNGGPDGIALVDAADNIIQFLSYEGTLEATNGPAVGMTSEDVGVSEPGSTPIGHSLQLSGTGSRYEDFVWVAAAQNTFSEVNNGQDFVALVPFINEIHYDNTGGDSGEAIEVAGVTGTDLSTFSLVLYNGSNGTVYNTIELSGELTDQQNGFGTASFDISGIQNGAPDGIALVDAANNVIQFLSYEGRLDATDGPAVGMTSEDIGVSEPGSTPIGHSLQLAGNGTQSSDFIWETSAANTFGAVNANQTFAGGGDGNGAGPAICCDKTTFIHDVQGRGAASPLVGETVLIEGIVSASFLDINGFFLQEEDADADADPSTSEGIFVSYGGDLPNVGSLVSVIGDVSEFFERTQLTASVAPIVISTEKPAPASSSLFLPFDDATQVESLEGMLVSTAQSLVVTNNFALGRFGQVTLSTERLFVPTNIFAPGSDEANALEADNTLNRILLDDGNSNQNPEIVIFPTGGLSAANTLRLGDTVASLTGVVDFSFGDYRVLPTEEPTFVISNSRSAEPDLELGNLKVASLNVLNYFTTLNPDNLRRGPRGANTPVEFERQKVKTVAAIAAMDADIVGLMEIENNGFSEGSAINDLVSAINVKMGEGTYSIVDAGGPVGTDAITVALIYKSSKVSLSGDVKILNSSNSSKDENDVALFDDTKNRPSVIQKFVLRENLQELVISVNHLKSKGSGCGAGDDDTTTGQGNCNLTRTRAAQALVAFLNEQYADAPTLIIGDLNAYAKEDPISAIIDSGYTDLANAFGGAEAYSYSFGGRIGYLDHALANASALDKVVDTTEWHINADEPIILDYNVEFKSDSNINNYYAPDAYRMSDHDPIVIALQLDLVAINGDWDGDGDVDVDDIRGLIRAILSRKKVSIEFDLNADGEVNYRDIRAAISLCTRSRCDR
jgi:predicted extracellular nuclease/endonuclease I